MPDFIQVMTTAPTKDHAQAVARALLEAKLAACVQIAGPIESSYWWEGKIETATEWHCLAKSRLHLFAQIEAAIRAVHPYEVPEILVTRIEAGNAAYLGWLSSALESADHPG
jgi:periplasmic divalent cation tolerance protein